MIFSGALAAYNPPPVEQKLEPAVDAGGNIYSGRVMTESKQVISPETSKRIAAVYRCSSGIGDDIASMPLKHMSRASGSTLQVEPDPITRNLAYLLEVKPNRWMTPFIFKRTIMNWAMFWGNGLIWMPPPPAQRELFILPTSQVRLLQDKDGYLWYELRLPSQKLKYLPQDEITNIMINSTNGLWGRSIFEYARDTMGLRAGMSKSQSRLQGNGLNPAAYIQVEGSHDKEARNKIREAYTEALGGVDNSGSLAVFDRKVIKFEPITMKPSDAQMLESIEATDRDIANFFKYPEFKLNMGKQSYESNDAQEIDYLKSCLDPYAVQWEQAGRVTWLNEKEQKTDFLRFIRSSILRTDPKKRAEIHEIEIRSGTLKPNEARAHEDRNSYPEGDKFYMTKNYGEIGAKTDD
ncbi:MAG TPA: phage portal protein [Anaerolineae bacterium]|jgi:HK97 family phage portal protein|nr:phage portal protein [Anaerolineae bacterium]